MRDLSVLAILAPHPSARQRLSSSTAVRRFPAGRRHRHALCAVNGVL